MIPQKALTGLQRYRAQPSESDTAAVLLCLPPCRLSLQPPCSYLKSRLLRGSQIRDPNDTEIRAGAPLFQFNSSPRFVQVSSADHLISVSMTQSTVWEV